MMGTANIELSKMFKIALGGYPKIQFAQQSVLTRMLTKFTELVVIHPAANGPRPMWHPNGKQNTSGIEFYMSSLPVDELKNLDEVLCQITGRPRNDSSENLRSGLYKAPVVMQLSTSAIVFDIQEGEVELTFTDDGKFVKVAYIALKWSVHKQKVDPHHHEESGQSYHRVLNEPNKKVWSFTLTVCHAPANWTSDQLSRLLKHVAYAEKLDLKKEDAHGVFIYKNDVAIRPDMVTIRTEHESDEGSTYSKTNKEIAEAFPDKIVISFQIETK